MTIKLIIKETIWEYQKDHIDFLYSKRKNHKILTDRIGINMSIIINSACYLEGSLEYYIKLLLDSRFKILKRQNFEEFPLRRIKNTFINSIENEFENRISRTTGLEQFDSLVKLLSHKNKKSSLREFKNWEGVTVLFQLRNVLAHGRQVSATRVSSYLTNNSWEDQFSGGYKKAEEYLLKRKLISKKFTENHNVNHLFTNKVTDHFNSISKLFFKFTQKVLESELKDPKMNFSDLGINTKNNKK